MCVSLNWSSILMANKHFMHKSIWIAFNPLGFCLVHVLNNIRWISYEQFMDTIIWYHDRNIVDKIFRHCRCMLWLCCLDFVDWLLYFREYWKLIIICTHKSICEWLIFALNLCVYVKAIFLSSSFRHWKWKQLTSICIRIELIMYERAHVKNGR